MLFDHIDAEAASERPGVARGTPTRRRRADGRTARTLCKLLVSMLSVAVPKCQRRNHMESIRRHSGGPLIDAPTVNVHGKHTANNGC